MAGYWRDTGHGYQWISGYWANAAEQETTYLPPPPATLEIGANIAAPSEDYGWMPGCWVWQQSRYAWRAGYWAQGRADWVWIPAYYVWTPRGVIFVDGFWDYPVERRGVLFAPVYYQSRGYARRGYSYSPRIAINLAIFTDNLFLRPSYHHYYFGDYYGSRYERGGFYASISFQSSRSGFDPFFSHDRWEHRSDRDWDNRFRASYQNRRDNSAARPPRTWADQQKANQGSVAGGEIRAQIAAPIGQLSRGRDNPVRFQPVPAADRQKFAQRGREVQQSRDQRKTVEAKVVVPAGRKPNETVGPARVVVPRSPIVARPAEQRGNNQNPPKAPPTPRPDPRIQPKTESPVRQPAMDQRPAPSGSRPPETERDAGNRRAQNVPPAAEPRASVATVRAREETLRSEQQRQIQAQQDVEKPTKDQAPAPAAGGANAQQEAPRQAQAQREAAARSRDALANSQATEKARQNVSDAAAAKAKDESQRRERDSQLKAQRDQGERANAAAAKAQEDSQRNTQEAQARARQAAEEQNNASAAKGQEAAQGRALAVQVKAQQDAAKRAHDAAAKAKPLPKEKPPAQDDDNDAKREKDKPRGN